MSTCRRRTRSWKPSADAFVAEVLVAMSAGSNRPPSSLVCNRRSIVVVAPTRIIHKPLTLLTPPSICACPLYLGHHAGWDEGAKVTGASMTDWRLQGQERFLKGVSLAKQNYRRYREGWEHDHCEFCGAKFSERPEDLNVGYATTDCYHWICEDCYKDFKGQKGSGVFVGKIGSYKDSRPLCPDLHVPAGKRFDWPAHRRVGSRRGANLVLYRRRQMGRRPRPRGFLLRTWSLPTTSGRR